MSTILTAKGQVTIPKKIRDVLGLAPGTAVGFDVDKQGRIVIYKASEKPSRPIRRRVVLTASAGGPRSSGVRKS